MGQPKAVLCDDDRTTTLVLKRLLEKLGFHVTVGNNGTEGLALVRSEHPTLVILDLDMPVKNGIQVLTELKGTGENLPYIIVLTAHESADDAQQVTSLGAQEMLVKPFIATELVAKVQRLIAAGKV